MQAKFGFRSHVLVWSHCGLFLSLACSGSDSDDGASGGDSIASSGGSNHGTGGAAASGGAMSSSGGTQGGSNGIATGGRPGTGGGAAVGGTDAGGSATGGTGSSGGAQSTGGAAAVQGDIALTDAAPGFASMDGGTTGGGTDWALAVTVSTMDELRSAISGSEPRIVLVEPGQYSGSVQPGANKTIIGIEPGVKITGSLSISGADKNNVIVRNIAVQGEKCSSYDECRAGADAVYVGNGAHHVWLDHLDISDGQDGNCDITKAADLVTVSWSHFYYTYDKEHRFSNLIAGSDDETESIGKLRITYMNSHFGERVDSRQPRGRFGDIHMLNNYHDTGGGQIHGVGKDMALLAENSVYDESRSIWTDMGSPRGWKGVGNIGTGADLDDSRGTVFEVPYEYEKMPATEVVDALLSSECGVGNTCSLTR